MGGDTGITRETEYTKTVEQNKLNKQLLVQYILSNVLFKHRKQFKPQERYPLYRSIVAHFNPSNSQTGPLCRKECVRVRLSYREGSTILTISGGISLPGRSVGGVDTRTHCSCTANCLHCCKRVLGERKGREGGKRGKRGEKVNFNFKL